MSGRPETAASRAEGVNLCELHSLSPKPAEAFEVATAYDRIFAVDRYLALTNMAVLRVMLLADNCMGLGIPATCPTVIQSCSRTARGPAEEEADIRACISCAPSAPRVGSEAMARAAETAPVE